MLSSRVRLSITSRYCIETTGCIELGFFARRLPFTCPTLGCKEIWASVAYSGLTKFRHGKSIALSTTLVVVVVDGRACRRHLYDNRRVVAVYYKSVNCNSTIAICCGFVVQLVSTADKILTDIARRAVRLRWQSFLLTFDAAWPRDESFIRIREGRIWSKPRDRWTCDACHTRPRPPPTTDLRQRIPGLHGSHRRDLERDHATWCDTCRKGPRLRTACGRCVEKCKVATPNVAKRVSK